MHLAGITLRRMSISAKSPLTRALPALIAVIIIWSSIPLFLKHFTGILDAWTVNAIRYVLAALFWLPYVLREYRTRIRGTRLLVDAIWPAIFHTVGQALWALAPYYNDASIMHFIGRMSFLFSMLFGYILLKQERGLFRQPLFWAGAAGTFAGIVLMYVGGVGEGSTSPLGLAILIATAASWAMYGVSVRRRLRAYSARLGFGVISLYTAPMLLLVMFLWGDWTRAAHVDAWNGFLIAVSAIGGISLGHVLLYKAIQHIGPIVTDGAFQLLPFLTAVGAMFLLGEAMTGLQWTGGVFLVAAAYALLMTKTTPPQEAGP